MTKAKTHAKTKAKEKTKRKPTAIDRLKAMESIMIEMNNKIIALAGVIDDNKEGVLDLVDKLDQKVISVAKRINATVTATDSKDSVEKIIQQNTVKELADLVNVLLTNKVIVNDSEGVVVDKSFVVGRHISKDGDEITPRLQFYAGSLAPEEKEKFLGKKIGDLILSDDSEVSIEITELFLVQTPDKEVEVSDIPLESVKKEEIAVNTESV